MRLEYDLEIRNLAGNILPDDLGMDIGDGWRDVISTAKYSIVCGGIFELPP